jgi:transposase
VKQPRLFPLADPQEDPPMSRVQPKGRPRLVRPNRQQVEWRPVALDALLAEDPAARAIWAYAEQVDLGPLEAEVRSVEGHAGRPVSDRRVVFALWLYATFEGVGSARELARLCDGHLAYLWLRGGVPVDCHMLSDFRTEHAEWLDGLLTASLATLMEQGVMTLQRVSQDGLRVRASAGKGSFRKGERLAACLRDAEEQVARLRRELDADPGATTRRQAAARERAARERHEDIETLSAPPHEVTVYSPVRESKQAKLPAHEPHPGESAAVTAWRVRMGTPQAQAIYKERAATAECVNAQARNHGFTGRGALVRLGPQRPADAAPVPGGDGPGMT